MLLLYCPSCGSRVSDEAYYCPHCGKPLPRIYAEGLVSPSALIYLFPDRFLPPLTFMHFIFGEMGFKSPTSNVRVRERSAAFIMIAASLIWLRERKLIAMSLSEERSFSGLIKFPAVIVRRVAFSNLKNGSLEDIILNRVLRGKETMSVYSITRRILDLRGVMGIFGFSRSFSFILKLVESYLAQKNFIKVKASILYRRAIADKERVLRLDKSLEDVRVLILNFRNANNVLFQRIIDNIDRGFYSKLPLT